MWNLDYRWKWQLGKLAQRMGNNSEALEAYEGAVQSIDYVRDSLQATNTDFQFSFREQIEPIYKEYLRLLIDSPTPDYAKVLNISDEFYLVELENYLGLWTLKFSICKSGKRTIK